MEKIETKYSAASSAHYSPGIRHNGVLYISGQLSLDPETGKVPQGGIGAETKQALQNLELVLQSANLGREDVLMCRVYITDIADWPEVNQVYAEFFGDHKPARAVIPVRPLYADCLVEIEAVAAAERT